MATLKCNFCEGNIPSNARRVQCPHCGELFPFACARCEHKLRPPFSVFDDERYLTFDTPPLPLCDEHYLRQCPDCDQWFGADENPGYFRCAPCAQIHTQQQTQQAPEVFAATGATLPASEGGVATKTRPVRPKTRVKTSGANTDVLAIAFAVCAFVALVGWSLMKAG